MKLDTLWDEATYKDCFADRPNDRATVGVRVRSCAEKFRLKKQKKPCSKWTKQQVISVETQAAGDPRVGELLTRIAEIQEELRSVAMGLEAPALEAMHYVDGTGPYKKKPKSQRYKEPKDPMKKQNIGSLIQTAKFIAQNPNQIAEIFRTQLFDEYIGMMMEQQQQSGGSLGLTNVTDGAASSGLGLAEDTTTDAPCGGMPEEAEEIISAASEGETADNQVSFDSIIGDFSLGGDDEVDDDLAAQLDAMEEEAGTNSDNTGGGSEDSTGGGSDDSTGGGSVDSGGDITDGCSEDSGQDSDGTGDKQEAQGAKKAAHRCRQLKPGYDGENRSKPPSIYPWSGEEILDGPITWELIERPDTGGATALRENSGSYNQDNTVRFNADLDAKAIKLDLPENALSVTAPATAPPSWPRDPDEKPSAENLPSFQEDGEITWKLVERPDIGAADAALRATARRQNGHIYKENDRVRFDKTHDAIAFHLWP